MSLRPGKRAWVALVPVLALVLASATVYPRCARARSAAPLVAAPESGTPVRRFALVIGNNFPPRVDLPRLRYADDDAVRWTVLFATLGAEVETLTELDAESRLLYGDAVPAGRAPSRAELGAAVERIAVQVAAAHAQGARAVFYFVYAGHGDVEDGQGYLTLSDARFSRADLATLVLERAHADTNHVIVDACRASYFLGNRGPGGERRPWQDPYFNPGAAPLPHTGFLLSSSSSGLSHEWEEFQAGIFSHEVRSGLLGAADANGDGRISYAELTGFVRQANRPVRNQRFRPHIVARAPEGSDGVLLDLRDARAGSLAIVPTGPTSHQMLEDHAGVRWADLHPGANGPVRLILPQAAFNGPGFYLRSLASNTEYAVPAGGDVKLADLPAQAPSLLRRGALHDAFTHLFELPFDQAALDALRLDPEPVDLFTVDSPGADLAPSPARRPIARRAAVGLTIAGGVSLATSATLAILGARLRDSAGGKSGTDRARINQQIEDRNRWSAIAGIGGAALAAAGVGLWLWR
ncbi:MAG TPA: caspase family protein [Polyangia bacterium]|nr:caspase family protein [Polyangia bacterium]